MKVFFFLFLIALSSASAATKQIDERLIISGNSYFIGARPLHELYEPDDLTKLLKPELCTASWRGYRGDWEIVEGKLLLNSIEKNPCHDGYEEVEAILLFKKKEYPIFAEWFTGEIELQVSETEYLFEDNDEDKDLLGVNYNAVVFSFKSGILISTDLKQRKRRYN